MVVNPPGITFTMCVCKRMEKRNVEDMQCTTADIDIYFVIMKIQFVILGNYPKGMDEKIFKSWLIELKCVDKFSNYI